MTDSLDLSHSGEMHRLSREDVVVRLFVAIKTAPKHILTKLRGLPGDSDRAASELAEIMADQVCGDSTCVVQTDPLPNSYEMGKFGVDEEWPERRVVTKSTKQ